MTSQNEPTIWSESHNMVRFHYLCPWENAAPAGPRQMVSSRSSAARRGNDEDRSGRMVDDLGRDRPDQLRTPSAHAARAQDDHVGVSAGVDEFFGRVAVNCPDRNRLRAGIAEPGQHLLGFRLGRLGDLLDLDVVVLKTEGAGPTMYGLMYR